MRTIRIFVSREFEPYANSFYKYLNEQLKSEVEEELGKEHAALALEFVTADEPRGDLSIDEKIGGLIRGADLVLALCFPPLEKGKKQKHGDRAWFSPWIPAEVGYAFAHDKDIQAIYVPPIDPDRDLGFARFRDHEFLRLVRSDFAYKTGRPAPEFNRTLRRWLVKWISGRYKRGEFEHRPEYFHQFYVKDTTVYPDGYGFVRLQVIAVVNHPGRQSIPHEFGAEMDPNSAPRFSELQRNFAAHQRGDSARLNHFSFLTLDSPYPLTVQEAGVGPLGKEDLPMEISHRWPFDVVRADGQVLPPGQYRYEFSYGLHKLFRPDFAADFTSAVPHPALVLGGIFAVRFRVNDPSLDWIRRLSVRLVEGKEEKPFNFDPLKEVNSQEIAFVFRGVMRHKKQLRLRWGDGATAQK